MKLSKNGQLKFVKGYQAQHDDMFNDLKEYFSDIQGVILDHDFQQRLDFEDFGRDAFIYKLEQYCKQVRLMRSMQGLTNSIEKPLQ